MCQGRKVKQCGILGLQEGRLCEEKKEAVSQHEALPSSPLPPTGKDNTLSMDKHLFLMVYVFGLLCG